MRAARSVRRAGFDSITLSLVIMTLWACSAPNDAPEEGGEGPMRSAPVAIESLEEAPDFSLTSLDGEAEVQLSALRGQIVILDFWATWCAPCVAQVPPLNALYDLYRERGDVQVFGISVDLEGPEAVRAWVAENGVRYPILMGGESVAHRYGALGFPATFVVGPEGRIRERHVGVVDAEVLDRTLVGIRRASPSHRAHASPSPSTPAD